MTIQWFPGHMAKARRELEEKLNLVDLIIELVDARAPSASQNPMLQKIIKDKTKIILLMKKDLADPEQTKQWLAYYEQEAAVALAINVNDPADIKKVIRQVREVGNARLAKLIAKGANPRPIRAMIIGIPNVGKSSLINRLANRKIAKIGDRPGITKQQTWIKVKDEFDLLDTPGILWPKFDDEAVGYRLAALGTIKDSILSLQDIAAFVITYLQANYADLLYERFKIDEQMDDMWEVFETIGRKHGALESGGVINFDKVANIILGDLRSGRLGRITLETKY